MKVKDVLCCAAVHMGMNELKNFILSPAEDEVLKGEEEEFLLYYNEVEKEIAFDYFPLMREQAFETETGRINYDSFLYMPSSIKCIEGADGERKKYRMYASYLATDAGKVKAIYSYIPADKSPEDECEVFYGISRLTMAAGIIKSACLRRGMLTESAMWSKTYYDFLRAALTGCERPRRIVSRRWA